MKIRINGERQESPFEEEEQRHRKKKRRLPKPRDLHEERRQKRMERGKWE